MPPKVTVAGDIDPLSNRSPGEDGATQSQIQPPSSESSGGGENLFYDNDMLSRLPDHILIHILSLLPTKHVRRTSVLSHRWRRLYEHVPVLDLAESDFNRCPKDLCAFLSSARCIEGPFHTLKIRAGTNSCWCWINWLNFNKNIGLKKLHVINGTCPDGTSLSKFLAITSLKELHLDLEGHLTWPRNSHMPSLQKLHLQSIILDVDDASANSVTSININSHFPALEDYTMSSCILPSVLVVSSRQLKRFALSCCNANRILVAADSLIDFSIHRCTFEAKQPLHVEILAPNIRHFTWECTELGHSNISTFNSLLAASIDVSLGGHQLHVINGTCPDDTSLLKFLAITSLKELHLDLEGHLTWPRNSLMPSLQKLHLQSIILDVDDASANSVTSINIYSHFPALEDYTMSSCIILPSVLVVSGRQLKRFALSCCNANRILVAADSLIDFSIRRCTFEAEEPLRVEIAAPNIRYFTWECTELGHSDISTFNSLVAASIDVSLGGDQLVLKDTKLLMSAVSKAGRLRLGGGAFEAFSKSQSKAMKANTMENINLNNIIEQNTYKNLLTLELWLHHCKIYYVGIFYLFSSCPKLKTLIIHNEQIACVSQSDHIFEPKHLWLEDLETIQIHEFIGTKLEMSFVSSLLRVSKKLTKITIFPALRFFAHDRYKQKLSLIYQLGKDAVFDFVFPDSSSLPQSVKRRNPSKPLDQNRYCSAH